MVEDEALKKYSEKATIKEVLTGGKNKGQNSLREQILAQDQYKQEIIDGLLKVRRTVKPMQDEGNGEVYLQEFVRLEDGTGQWKQLQNISEEKWEELQEGGVINREGAREVLAHLNSISNNNVSLSNLTKTQINDIGRSSSLSLLTKLNNNREQFGIESTDNLEWILFSVVIPNIMAGLSKAKNGEMIGELLRETKLVGSFDPDDEDEKQGWLASFQ